ncbi:MAG: triosephosphate isomerase [Candidatus Pacebacteria bacterium]|nr:triosephosphate isomerase [Candidatus Paceibacterota bacterium]MBP9867020.1 triosephosphate isomerase [Candidatus Paceibacterota bacterium]
MSKRTTPLIVGNWKATPETLDIAKKFIKQLDKKCEAIHSSKKTKLSFKLPKKVYFLAVPEVFITSLSDSVIHGYIGAENISGIKIGQLTGTTTVSQLKSAGASFVIIGHSEIREQGETLIDCAKKVEHSLSLKLPTILCFGENHRDKNGNYLNELEENVKQTLSLVDRNLFENLIIAYEPLWAIGSSVPATTAECFEVVIALRRALASLVGIDYAKKVQVLYGGAVTKETAKSFLEEGGVDGLLIGRASQDVDTFMDIITTCYSNQ